jgi:hypothetical protein
MGRSGIGMIVAEGVKFIKQQHQFPIGRPLALNLLLDAHQESIGKIFGLLGQGRFRRQFDRQIQIFADVAGQIVQHLG